MARSLRHHPLLKYFGVFFDRSLGMEDQINLISIQCLYQLCNIGRIRKLITENVCKTLVCSFATSRLNYGNASLYWLSLNSVSRLQIIQIQRLEIYQGQEHDHHWNFESSKSYLRLFLCPSRKVTFIYTALCKLYVPI